MLTLHQRMQDTINVVKFLTAWEANLIHRMGYQRKGYTSGEIGFPWLKDWDAQTKAKAKHNFLLFMLRRMFKLSQRVIYGQLS